MPGFGESLKEARLRLGLSVKNAARKAKINESYVEALENEDVARLMDKDEVMATLLKYAPVLGLNPETVVSEFQKSWSDPRMAKAFIQQSFIQSRHRSLTGNRFFKAAALLVLVLLATGAVFWYLNAGEPVSGNKPVPEENESKPDEPLPEETDEPAEAEQPAPEEPEQPGVMILEIKLTRGDCWLEVTVDNELVLYETVRSGETLLFEGKQEISVVFGNAGAVDVVFNGEELGQLGSMKEVVKRRFVPQ